MYSIIGSCSICGGRVKVSSVFYSITLPSPQCERCGAIAAFHGPVIPMVPNRIDDNQDNYKLSSNG